MNAPIEIFCQCGKGNEKTLCIFSAKRKCLEDKASQHCTLTRHMYNRSYLRLACNCFINMRTLSVKGRVGK